MVWITVIVVATLVLSRVAAPWVIEGIVESRLRSRPDLSGHVDDVDICVWEPSITLQGVHLSSTPTSSRQLTSDIDAIHLHTSWRDLLRGDTRMHVDLRRPRVQVDALGEAASDGEPPTLAGIRSIRVEDGTVAVRVRPSESEAMTITLRAIDLHLRETAPRANDTMTGRFEVDATVATGGSVRAEGALSFDDPAERWTADLVVTDLRIPPFNPLLRTLLRVDAQRGRLSLTGQLTSIHGLTGHISPRFSELELYGTREKTRRPMTEAVFAEMLAGADGTIPIERPPRGDAGRPDAPLRVEHTAGLMRDIIRRGYDRRLDDLDGYFATVGGLDIDLEAGLLRFRDISILKDHMSVPLPFFYTRELEVRIDRSVVRDDGDDLPPLKEVTLRAPTLTFVEGPTDESSQIEFDPQWPDKVSSLPYPTETLHVVDGRVEFWHIGTTAALAYLSDVDADIARMHSGRREPEERRAVFEVDASLMGDAPLHVSGAYRPGARLPDMQIELALETFDLPQLNPLARALLDVDVARGTAKVWARLDTAEGRTLVRVEPQLRDVEMIGAHEHAVERPLAEFVLGEALRERASRAVTVEYTSDDPLRDVASQVGRALVSRPN